MEEEKTQEQAAQSQETVQPVEQATEQKQEEVVQPQEVKPVEQPTEQPQAVAVEQVTEPVQETATQEVPQLPEKAPQDEGGVSEGGEAATPDGSDENDAMAAQAEEENKQAKEQPLGIA